jgi:hypothetical protein
VKARQKLDMQLLHGNTEVRGVRQTAWIRHTILIRNSKIASVSGMEAVYEPAQGTDRARELSDKRKLNARARVGAVADSPPAQTLSLSEGFDEQVVFAY